MLLASCSSVDYQELGQFNYLSCKNIAKASQDIFKKYPSLGKDQTKSSSGFFKNKGNNDSVEIIAGKKDLEQLNYSAKLKGCEKISL
jgi:hypothetical protein